MILEREQINRYLRHIIIPEISGPGQKKLLESSVYICGENVKSMSPVIYYLAAAGVGHISCRFSDSEGIENLIAAVKDLNDDILLELADRSSADVQVLMGTPQFIIEKQICSDLMPAIVAIYNGWKGVVQFFSKSDSMHSFFAKVTGGQPQENSVASNDSLSGDIFSNCVSGALCAMETIMVLLDMTETMDEFLYFNLLTMEFFKVDVINLERYLAELRIAEQQNDVSTLRDCNVLIVGAGGLGSPAAYALATAGIGTLGLVDYDTVEVSNLNRQILHGVSRLGMPKTESAAIFLRNLNPDLTINLFNTSLNKENVYDIIAGYDVVIDAVDNFPTRFLLNDACFFTGKPLIDAGVIRFDGTFRTILPKKGPCYRCTLSEIPSPGTIPSCAESGVLGPLPGVMGFIQAAEAVKLLLRQGIVFSDKLLFFDGMFSDFCTIKLKRNSACPLCGTEPLIHELQEYEFICPDDRDKV